jgi:catechol 2,3-dioxygenase-like lactoylglutathione lyase family enzyme
MTDKPLFDQYVTFLYTRDLAATADFYERLVGLPLVRDQGGCRIYRISQDGYLGFCDRASAPEEPVGIICTFVVDDVDGWYERLAAKGVEFTKAPAANPDYAIYHCFFRDPNGYLLEIQRFDVPLE